MKPASKGFHLSASDLSNHLACNHLTSLDLSVTRGDKSAPSWRSPDLWVLQERDIAHEKAYLKFLATKGLTIVDLRDVDDDAKAFGKTERMIGAWHAYCLMSRRGLQEPAVV